MRMKWGRMGLKGFDRHREISPEEWTVLEGKTASTPAPVAAPPKTVNRTTARVSAPAPIPMPKAKKRHFDPTIYDLLMWVDLVVGTYSLFQLFGPFVGLLVGAKISLFFEAGRRKMHIPNEAPSAEWGTTKREQEEDNYRMLNNVKSFAFIIVACLSGIFTWANGQSFFAALKVYAPQLATTSTADYCARMFALAVTAISLSSMLTIAISSRTKSVVR